MCAARSPSDSRSSPPGSRKASRHARHSTEHALCACRAQLAEAPGDRPEAAALYAEAADRWQEFRDVPERAYALLGQSRCQLALGRAATEPLAEARELFATMGYEPSLAEIDALLDRETAAAS